MWCTPPYKIFSRVQPDAALRAARSLVLVLLAVAVASCTLPSARTQRLPDIVIDGVNVFPESMSAAANGAVYIGSIRGTVYRAPPGGDRAVAWLTPTPQNGILSLLGVLADDARHTLWLCSAPNPLVTPAITGTSALLAIDLRDRSRKGYYPLPPPASTCNDISIAPDGSVFASDTPNGRVFRLPPGGKALELFAQDARLKGIDGLVFGGDGTLYVNIVTRSVLIRIERTREGLAGGLTELATSQPLAAPDGFRLIAGNRFLLAEGNGGRIDEVRITGDTATVQVLREGLVSPPAVTLVGHTAYALEGKIGYLVDPKLRGQDPGVFRAYAVPLDETQH